MKKIIVIEGECVVRERAGTKNLQAWFNIDGGYRRESTRTSDPDEAKKYALNRYMEINALKQRGVPLRQHGKLVIQFNDVAQMIYQQMQEDIASGLGKPVYQSYMGVIEQWLLPYFDGVALTDVDEDAIYEFERHRLNTLGREPAKTTINTHNVVFRSIFALARRKKYIKAGEIPEFTVKGKGKKSVRRPVFTVKEMVALEKFMLGWSENHPRSITRYKRRLLLYYVMLLQKSGIRPGKEIDSICWKHIDTNYLNTTNGIHYIRIDLPHRKTERPSADDYVLVTQDFQMWLDAIAAHTKRTEPDDYLFAAPDGTVVKGFSELFRYCLIDADMYYSKSGKGRTLYSLRHFFATETIGKRLVPYDVLAKHMATSVQMLHDFYVEVQTEMNAEGLAPSYIVPADMMGDDKNAAVIRQIEAMDVDDATKAVLKAALR